MIRAFFGLLEGVLAVRLMPLDEAFELLLEARETAATVHELGIAARPCWMRGRIDIERKRVAFFAVGRIGDEFRSVGHDHLDLVVVRVLFWVLHVQMPVAERAEKTAPPADPMYQGGAGTIVTYVISPTVYLRTGAGTSPARSASKGNFG